MDAKKYKERFRRWVERNPLRKARKADGLTTVELAGILDVSHKTIQYWETNITKPSRENLTKIAEYMDTSLTRIAASWQRWLDHRPTMEGENNEEKSTRTNSRRR